MDNNGAVQPHGDAHGHAPAPTTDAPAGTNRAGPDPQARGSGSATVLLGVAGGIAAYKACELLRHFAEAGHDVHVIPTEGALNFVGRTTFEALSGNPVRTGVFTDAENVNHVRLGRGADLVVVAPATADLLARAATGRSDDLLSATLLTASAPVLMAPAMHTEMWLHPATIANVEILRSRGVVVCDPDSGRLTGADSGPGRLPHPLAIAATADALLRAGHAGGDLAGRRVVVSAGGTREYLDPVRFLGNRSSGMQGYALAAAARARGASVLLVAANTIGEPPAGVEVHRVETTEQLQRAMEAGAEGADAVVMAAAPADFRPAAVSAWKIKKADDHRVPALELVQTPDILRGLTQRRPPGQVIVGFAAETGDSNGEVADYGRAKLRAKGVDLLVVNEVGTDKVFGRPDNAGMILDADGGSTDIPLGPKAALAAVVIERIAQRLRI